VRADAQSPASTAHLQFAMVAPIVVVMGDKSPKSKQRGQQQKNALKATNASQAKAKQEGYSRTVPTVGKK
jgi:hypothetical protein